MLISERRYRRLLNAIWSLTRTKVVVININYMGLGNRLKLLAHYHRNFNLDGVTLYWNVEGWVNSPFSDLFTFSGASFREVPIHLKSWMVPVICSPEKPHSWPRGYWRFDVGSELGPEYEIVRNGRRFPAIDFLYERTPQPYLDDYRAFFSQLRPTAVVGQRIAAVSLPPRCVGIQLRISDDPKDEARFPTFEAYVAAMRGYGQDVHYFVSAMNREVADALRREFGDRILELPEKNYRSMIDATADMYLLGACEQLLVSDGSTFGEVAWWLGGARQPVRELKVSASS
jgi:hypothetical protein